MRHDHAERAVVERAGAFVKRAGADAHDRRDAGRKCCDTELRRLMNRMRAMLHVDDDVVDISRFQDLGDPAGADLHDLHAKCDTAFAKDSADAIFLHDFSPFPNPKSSTGRIDIFTRLIVDRGEAFDDVPLDYEGELWLEISPRSFSVRVKVGSKLSQVRFRSRHPQQRDRHTFTLEDAEIRKRHLACPLVDSPLDLREGLVLRVDLGGLGESVVGYQAIKNSDVIDVSRLRGYAIEDFWEPIRAREDRRLPTVTLTDAGRRVTDIHDFRAEHFEIADYEPHPYIGGIPVSP